MEAKADTQCPGDCSCDKDGPDFCQWHNVLKDEQEWVPRIGERWVCDYFERQDTQYVFRKDLRRSVIFGRNDLVQDAPISRIDLLACRNTLMYFNAETQAQVLNRMHFALRPDNLPQMQHLLLYL